jgi:hypothetical protein
MTMQPDPNFCETIVVPQELSEAMIDVLVPIWRAPRDFVVAFYQGKPN